VRGEGMHRKKGGGKGTAKKKGVVVERGCIGGSCGDEGETA
jgi:hypothetical protein